MEKALLGDRIRIVLHRGLLGCAVGVAIWLGLPKQAAAGYFELGASASFNRSNYGEGRFEWTRRWTASLGYHFSERSELEVAFQDSFTRTNIPGYQNTTFHDQTCSASWIQSFFGKQAIIDPYLKAGIGQLNRVARGTYDSMGGASADSETGSLTEILGIGVRIGLTKRFGIRAEANTYITDFKISSWKDNVYVTTGLSFYL
jgi:hypothetical protein